MWVRLLVGLTFFLNLKKNNINFSLYFIRWLLRLMNIYAYFHFNTQVLITTHVSIHLKKKQLSLHTTSNTTDHLLGPLTPLEHQIFTNPNQRKRWHQTTIPSIMSDTPTVLTRGRQFVSYPQRFLDWQQQPVWRETSLPCVLLPPRHTSASLGAGGACRAADRFYRESMAVGQAPCRFGCSIPPLPRRRLFKVELASCCTGFILLIRTTPNKARNYSSIMIVTT